MPTPAPVSALVDVTTEALLFLTPQTPVVVFLSKTMPEVEHLYCVNYPNYLQKFELAELPPERWPEWSWESTKRAFEPTVKDLLTERLLLCSKLIIKKAQAAVEVMRLTSMARYPVLNGVLMQEVVYAAKKTQAQRYKDAGYPDDELDYPYVIQYADFAGLTMRAAADEILLKASFADDLLQKTEWLRMKYFNRIKDVRDVEEAGRIVMEFRYEFFKTFEIDDAIYPL
jgi:hypothetical protein